ncbi:hypothetical protein SFRURICE_018940 [Spodoptera frugiperda]|nr:hypothetical protein SFRURICE_018940 [Spodoptera frugiperda]
MSSIPRHTTRRLSRCYWRFEDRAHRALCLESRALSGVRDDVGSLDSFAGGCAGVRFDSRVGAKTVPHTALTMQEVRTPQNNDAQCLYNLNATIQQECRKYGNSAETVTRILHKFKEDNPQIINRVQLQCSRSDNRTDVSAECSYVPYSEEKSLLSHEDSDTNKVSKNVRTPEKSPVERLELVDDDQHRNYASVQSSEQLLNSVIHNDDSAEVDDRNTSDIEMVRSDYDEVTKVGDYVDESNGQFQNSFNNETHGRCTPPGNNIDINEEDTNATETSSLDSDIAEALTQIVEEYSSKNVTHSQRSSDMSIDEDLINETIHEINEELSNEVRSVENIILTPPLSFRDM